MKLSSALYIILFSQLLFCCKKNSGEATTQPLLDCQADHSTILQVSFGNPAVPHYFTVQQSNGYSLFGPVYKRELAAGILSDTVTLFSQTTSTYSSWSAFLVATDNNRIIWDSVTMVLNLKQCNITPVSASY